MNLPLTWVCVVTSGTCVYRKLKEEGGSNLPQGCFLFPLFCGWYGPSYNYTGSTHEGQHTIADRLWKTFSNAIVMNNIVFWFTFHFSLFFEIQLTSLQWRHNERDSVSNHQPHDCLLNRLFGCKSKKTSKLLVTGLCAGNSPGTGEFSALMASNAENVSIWWRHHD